MSATSLCRLCICNHTEFKSLHDNLDQANKAYEITVKYFDPMFLNSQHYSKLSKGICINCWQQIFDFHNFQQSVYDAQKKFEEDLKGIVTNIKLEEDLAIDRETIDDNLSTSEENIVNEICLPQLDIIDIKNEDYLVPEMDKTDDDKSFTMGLLESLPKRTREKGRKKTKIIKQVKSKQIQSAKRCRLKTSDINKKIEKEMIAKETDFNDGNESDDDDNYNPDPEAFVSSNEPQKSTKAKHDEVDAFIAEWKPELECDLCKENFTNLTTLRRHFSSKHPQQKCYVSCCQRKLQQRFRIVEHIRYHMDANTFKCNICEKSFPFSRNLNYHMRDQHTIEGQERSFECSICQKRFYKKGALKSHLETHDTAKTYKCSQCEKGFSTEQRRKIHERSVHNVDRICEQCGKTLHGIAALKQHMLQHAGVKKKTWSCDQCNAELTSHFSLKRHKTIHDSSTVYVCNECGKTASTQMGLQSHKKYAHQLERKFKCTICDKAFKKAHVLREHMATHTGEDLYTCPHCPQMFKVNANMHHHRKKAHPKEWAEGRAKKFSGGKL